MSAALVAPVPTSATPAPSQGGATARVDLRREYVAGGTGAWNSALFRTLPFAIDDVTADFGADLYERISLDARVAAETDNLKAAILEDGVILAPAVSEAGADGYALAATIADAATAMLADLDPALDDTLWDLLSALTLGSRVAEETYEYGDVAGRTGLLLTALRTKPRRNVAYVVDAYNRLVGFLARRVDQPGLVGATSYVGSVTETANLLPRDKFALLSNRPVDGDPRGTSILRPVYTPWVAKQQMLREHIKYLTQFASPSLVAFLPQGAQDTTVLDEAGEPTDTVLTAAEVMFSKLITFANGTALVLPYGAELKELYSTGDGAAFLRAFEMYNRDITLALTGQSLATTEGEHQARAAASVHQDILATRVKQAKLAVARTIRRDILQQFVRLNWGDDAAKHLTPLVNLGSVEEEDVTPRMTAVAALERAGYLAASQRPAIDVALGLPERTPEETVAETERANQPPPAPIAPGAAPADQPPSGQEDNNV